MANKNTDFDPELAFEFTIKKIESSQKRMFEVRKLSHFIFAEVKGYILVGNYALCEKVGENIYIVCMDGGGFHIPLIHFSLSFFKELFKNRTISGVYHYKRFPQVRPEFDFPKN